MKKSLLFFMFIIIAGMVNGQRSNSLTSMNFLKASVVIKNDSKGIIDSVLFFPSWEDECSENLTYYKYESGNGYLTGNNKYKDKEMAQKYLWNGGGKVKGVFALLAPVKRTGSTALKVYSVTSGTGAPNTTVATSVTFPLDTFLTPKLYILPLSTPVNCPPGGFFVSIVLPTGNNDTLVVFTTEEECYVDNNLAWLKAADNNWYNFSEDVGINFDIAILPIVEVETGETFVIGKNSEVLCVYPNPVRNTSIVNYSLRSASKVNFILNDLTGRAICNFDCGFQSEGIHNINIDLSSINNGFYYYSIQTENERKTSSLLINK